MALDRTDGHPVAVRCACDGVTAVGSNTVVWVGEGGRVHALELAASTAVRQLPLQLPDGMSARRVTAGNGDTFLLAAVREDGSGALFEVRLDGRATQLHSQRYLEDVAFAAARLHGTGRQYLVAPIEAQGDCVHPGPIVLLDSPEGRVSVTDTAEVKGDPQADVGLVDAWWNASGEVIGMMHSWVCAPDGGAAVTKLSWWRLVDGVWKALGADSKDAQRPLPDGSLLAVDADLTLTLARGTDRVKIADKVRQVAMPPSP